MVVYQYYLNESAYTILLEAHHMCIQWTCIIYIHMLTAYVSTTANAQQWTNGVFILFLLSYIRIYDINKYMHICLYEGWKNKKSSVANEQNKKW